MNGLSTKTQCTDVEMESRRDGGPLDQSQTPVFYIEKAHTTSARGGSCDGPSTCKRPATLSHWQSADE